MGEKIELIPNQDEISEPLFKTPQEYQAWRQEYIEGVKPEMDKWAAARRRSYHRFIMGPMLC